MSPLTVFVLAGFGTYLIRGSFIIGVGDRPLSPKVERLLRNVGPAVLAALTVSLLTAEGPVDFLTDIPELAGVAAGITTAVVTRKLFPTFLVGVAVFFVLRLFL